MADKGKDQIISAVLSLAMKMDIEKINISTLIKECGISRSLFYYYYEDMYALLEDLLSRDVEKMIDDCNKIEDEYESVKYYIYCSSGHFPMMKKIIGTKYYETAEKMMNKINRRYLRTAYEHKAGNIPMKPNDATFFIDFMSSGMTAYFFEHCADEKFDVEESARQLWKMLYSLVQNMDD